jgi:hypothetical protein
MKIVQGFNQERASRGAFRRGGRATFDTGATAGS